MKTSWLSLDCYKCGKHLGFMPYCGPTGYFYCDPCKEQDEREEDEADHEALRAAYAADAADA